MAVVDTSGSITDEVLTLICNELGKMATIHDVIVVKCDAAVHAIYPYQG